MYGGLLSVCRPPPTSPPHSLRIMGFGAACTDGGSDGGPPLAPQSPLETESTPFASHRDLNTRVLQRSPHLNQKRSRLVMCSVCSCLGRTIYCAAFIMHLTCLIESCFKTCWILCIIDEMLHFSFLFRAATRAMWTRISAARCVTCPSPQRWLHSHTTRVKSTPRG